jgi:hypothetical protein
MLRTTSRGAGKKRGADERVLFWLSTQEISRQPTPPPRITEEIIEHGGTTTTLPKR